IVRDPRCELTGSPSHEVDVKVPKGLSIEVKQGLDSLTSNGKVVRIVQRTAARFGVSDRSSVVWTVARVDLVVPLLDPGCDFWPQENGRGQRIPNERAVLRILSEPRSMEILEHLHKRGFFGRSNAIIYLFGVIDALRDV